VPVFARQALRRSLGQSWLRDTRLGSTTETYSLTGFSLAFIDNVQADLALSGRGLYQNTTLRFPAAASPSFQDFTVASFNTGSGAYISAQRGGLLANPIPSGAVFEVALLVPPAEKDLALDDAVQRIRVRQEVGITTVSGALFYDLTTAASPHRVADVLGAYYFADPSNTGNRDRKELGTPAVVPTATGIELRIDSALSLSARLVVDALLELTLGGEFATVNLPDDRLVLAGAAAKCWDLLAQRAPGTNAKLYEQKRDEAALEFSRLSARYKPPTAKRPAFDTVF
jgi:hypothetical protein